jgi:predicted hydrocarbon binding protein
MKRWERDVEAIKVGLTMDEAHRLMLGNLPMILTPRMFFVHIQKKVEEISGIDAARLIYYEAAFEIGYRYMENSKRVYQMSGRDLLQQYMDSVSVRGWGKFEILQVIEAKGEGRVRLTNSAIAEEFGAVGRSVCHPLTGAIAGAIQFLADEQDKHIEVEGTELLCMSKGDSYCEFAVAPKAVVRD